MKSEVISFENNDIIDYPKLIRIHDTGAIIFAKSRYNGTVIHTGSNKRLSMMEIIDRVDFNPFKKLKEVTIKFEN